MFVRVFLGEKKSGFIYEYSQKLLIRPLIRILAWILLFLNIWTYRLINIIIEKHQKKKMTIMETPLIKLSLSKNSKYLIDTNILCVGEKKLTHNLEYKLMISSSFLLLSTHLWVFNTHHSEPWAWIMDQPLV